MSFAELKSFHMVARLGSITQAAKKLGLSQPTVTTQIRSLEGQYGVELFYRGGRRLTLSDEGVRLLPMVQQLLQQEADIEFFCATAAKYKVPCASVPLRLTTCSTWCDAFVSNCRSAR